MWIIWLRAKDGRKTLIHFKHLGSQSVPKRQNLEKFVFSHTAVLICLHTSKMFLMSSNYRKTCSFCTWVSNFSAVSAESTTLFRTFLDKCLLADYGSLWVLVKMSHLTPSLSKYLCVLLCNNFAMSLKRSTHAQAPTPTRIHAIKMTGWE